MNREDRRYPTYEDFKAAWAKLTKAQQQRVKWKCQWEQMTLWAVMNEWGSDWGPARWQKGEIVSARATNRPGYVPPVAQEMQRVKRQIFGGVR